MLKTIKEFVRLIQSQRYQLYVSLLFSFCDGVLLMIPLIISYLMVSEMPEFNPTATTRLSKETVFLYMGVMMAVVLIRIFLRYFTMRLRSGAGYKAMCEERIRLGEHLKRVSLGFFTGRNLGDLVSTITSDAAFLEIEGLGVIEKAAMGIPALLIGLFFLFHVDYRIFVLTVVLLIPAWFSYRYFATTQDRLNINRQNLIGEVTEETVEFIRGIHILKSCCLENEQASRIRLIFTRLRKDSILNELAHLFPMASFQFWFRLITSGTVLLSGILYLRGEADFLRLFLLVVASFSLFQGVEAMGIFSIFSKMTQQSIDRIRDQLAQENVVVGIEKFFDDRKNVFRCNSYFTVLHSCMIDRFCRTFWRERYEQKICHPGRPDILTEKRRTVNRQACQSTVRMGDQLVRKSIGIVIPVSVPESRVSTIRGSISVRGMPGAWCCS